MDNINFNGTWLNEKIPFLKDGNRLYNIVCFCLGKHKNKMSYKEMYLFLYGLNKGKLGEKTAKEKALLRILEIYKSHHNNKLPEGIK